jgi:hypothetical protein
LHTSLIQNISIFFSQHLKIFMHPGLFHPDLHPPHFIEHLVAEHVHNLSGLLQFGRLRRQHAVNHDLRYLRLILLAQLPHDFLSLVSEVFVRLNESLFRRLCSNLELTH